MPEFTTKFTTKFTEAQSDAVAEAIRTRRTIHNFDPDRVPPREEVLAAIDLARWAPNHHLTEPWRFYVLGPETSEAIARHNADLYAASRGEQAGAAKFERWRGIPGWLLVTCARSADEQRQQEDFAASACAVQNLQLYLWTRGIGVKWTTGDVTRTDRFFEIVDVDPGEELLVGMMWYGYPADVAQTKRKPVRDVLKIRP